MSDSQRDNGRNMFHIMKQDLQNLQTRITLLEQQIQAITGQTTDSNGQGGASVGGETGAFNLANYKDTSGRIDFDRYNHDVKEAMYQTRQLTMAMRGYVMLAREAGLLDKDQEQAYQNIMRIIRMAYQAQRAMEQLQRMMDIAQAGMMTNPLGMAMAAVSFGGRIAGTLAYASRTQGTSGV
jgi:Tfp pilus assembly protein PilN